MAALHGQKKLFLAYTARFSPLFLCQSIFFPYFRDWKGGFFPLACLNVRANTTKVPTMRKEITFDKVMRTLFGLALCLLAYLLLRKLSGVLLPFFVAWLIAYLLYPIVRFFQYRCRLRFRIAAIVVTLLLVLGVIVGAGLLLIPPIVSEISRLVSIGTDFLNTQAHDSNLSARIREWLSQIDLKQMEQQLNLQDISSFLQERVPQLFSLVTGSVKALMNLVASLIAVIYLFFILMDYEKMSAGFKRLIPPRQRPFVEALFNDVSEGMNRYFRGQSLIAFLVGIMFSIGFCLIDFPLAIPLGLFIGVLNLVPYLQVVGFVPAILLALLKSYETGQNFWGIFFAGVIVFCVVQAIQDWILTPRIMGHEMGLNGAVILLALSVWGTLLGFIGMIIALPLTTLIISYYKRYVLHEHHVETFTHPATEPILEAQETPPADGETDKNKGI